MVVLRDRQRRHPWLAAPGEDLGLWREPFVETVEGARLDEASALEVSQIVGVHPRTANHAEDASKAVTRTGLGVRAIRVALRLPAEDGEVRLLHKARMVLFKTAAIG